MAQETVKGDGWAVGSIDGIGEGPGFRKVRRALDVTAFGVNVIVLPPGYDAPQHYHEEQEELYLVLRGTVEITFGEDERDRFTLEEGGLARVDAHTVRRVRNVGEGEAMYFIVGGKDGYVGRDGRRPGGAEAARPGAGA
jgi:mannose-6-phosphate isomerase-like protein (cupin superfamily)